MALPSTSPEGTAARARIREADELYREGIRRLALDDPEARDYLVRGTAIAPMNPEHYLALARVCRELSLDLRAAEYYSKFLAARPEAPEAGAAREELRAIDPELLSLFEVPADRRALETDSRSSIPIGVAVAIGILAGVLIVVGIALIVRRARMWSLADLAARQPELHPAIAYSIGTMRHELLKHRIGASTDAITALAAGRASHEQVAFVRERLYGGQPLWNAWLGHVTAFERALHGRFRADFDRSFVRAGRAIKTIAQQEGAMRSSTPRAAKKLAAAHRALREFDQSMRALSGRLSRTRVDRALLQEVFNEVRAEYEPGLVKLDAVIIDPPNEPVDIEVFRVDLVLILRNVLRNAILAVGRDEAPRRVGFGVELELEPTGEETVSFRIQDSSQETLTRDMFYRRELARGLGLVTAAVTRYAGSIEVESGSADFTKAVRIRFFRCLDG